MLNNKAQHLIEYMLIVMLVAAGIIIMGPYVIRSWNAHVKGYEDSVKDSYTDPLEYHTNETVTPACVCPPPRDLGCGAGPERGSNGGLKCPETTQLVGILCTPAGCEVNLPEAERPPVPECIVDESCCTIPRISNCGGLPPEHPCDRFEKLKFRMCGTREDYRCERDDSCVNTCEGGLLSELLEHKQGLCPGDDEGLRGPTPQQLVAACSDPDDTDLTKKCEVYCKPPFEFDASIPACKCPPPGSEDPITHQCICLNYVRKGPCPDGYVDATTCDEGYVLPCEDCPSTCDACLYGSGSYVNITPTGGKVYGHYCKPNPDWGSNWDYDVNWLSLSLPSPPTGNDAWFAFYIASRQTNPPLPFNLTDVGQIGIREICALGGDTGDGNKVEDWYWNLIYIPSTSGDIPAWSVCDWARTENSPATYREGAPCGISIYSSDGTFWHNDMKSTKWKMWPTHFDPLLGNLPSR